MHNTSSAARRYAAILALPVTLAALGTAVRAQTESYGPKSATFVCRPALPSETATAKMVVTSIALVCKPIAVSMHMSDGSMRTIGNVSSRAIAAPDFSGALTPQQINAAYNHWVEKALDIDPETKHTP
jgi:hypothetical protein